MQKIDARCNYKIGSRSCELRAGAVARNGIRARSTRAAAVEDRVARKWGRRRWRGGRGGGRRRRLRQAPSLDPCEKRGRPPVESPHRRRCRRPAARSERVKKSVWRRKSANALSRFPGESRDPFLHPSKFSIGYNSLQANLAPCLRKDGPRLAPGKRVKQVACPPDSGQSLPLAGTGGQALRASRNDISDSTAPAHNPAAASSAPMTRSPAKYSRASSRAARLWPR